MPTTERGVRPARAPDPEAARRAGLSWAEVARASGFSVGEILRIERGRGKLTYDDWRALAGGLGVDVSEIVPADVEPSGDAHVHARRR